MQTFLPYEDYAESASALDRPRLGKQRVEALQVLRGILEDRDGWRNHPARRMWEGHEGALAAYAAAVIAEWRGRGYRDTCRDRLDELVAAYGPRLGATAAPPPWLGDEAFHASHRSKLKAKDPEHYGRFGWPEEPGREYVWPTRGRQRGA